MYKYLVITVIYIYFRHHLIKYEFKTCFLPKNVVDITFNDRERMVLILDGTHI